MGVDYLPPVERPPTPPGEGVRTPTTERPARPRPTEPVGEDRWDGDSHQPEPDEQPDEDAAEGDEQASEGEPEEPEPGDRPKPDDEARKRLDQQA